MKEEQPAGACHVMGVEPYRLRDFTREVSPTDDIFHYVYKKGLKQQVYFFDYFLLNTIIEKLTLVYSASHPSGVTILQSQFHLPSLANRLYLCYSFLF